jgi:hypothetical protein
MRKSHRKAQLLLSDWNRVTEYRIAGNCDELQQMSAPLLVSKR